MKPAAVKAAQKQNLQDLISAWGPQSDLEGQWASGTRRVEKGRSRKQSIIRKEPWHVCSIATVGFNSSPASQKQWRKQMREPNILAAPADVWRGRCCQNASLLSSFFLFFPWIELNLRLNTGCPCQGSLLTVSCILGLQSHFLLNSLLHNLANVLFFYNWAKGHRWTTLLGVKCEDSWGTWARERGRSHVVVNGIFYCKPSLTHCGGGARICIQWKCMWTPVLLDVALYDPPGAHRALGQGWRWTGILQNPWAGLILLCWLPGLEMDAKNIRTTFSDRCRCWNLLLEISQIHVYELFISCCMLHLYDVQEQKPFLFLMWMESTQLEYVNKL